MENIETKLTQGEKNFKKAIQLVKADNFEEAITCCDKILKSESSHTLLYRMTKALKETCEADMSCIGDSEELRKKRFKIWVDAAYFFKREYCFEEAAILFDKALTLCKKKENIKRLLKEKARCFERSRGKYDKEALAIRAQIAENCGSSSKGRKVRYIGAFDAQVSWGDNADPRGVLEVGNVYEVKATYLYSEHTKLELVGFEEKYFNSASFRLENNG